MFDGIAHTYDRLNDLMTAGLHDRWRELAVLLSGVGRGQSALDVCCGTGDLAFALKRAVGPAGRVVGVDFSPEMLKVAREKAGRNQLYVEFVLADALDLPFANDSFDVCTVGFGLRNVRDVPAAIAEMKRVCKPGGRVVCLEITRPTLPGFREFYRVWFDTIVPWLGAAVAKDGAAYRYLPASVKRFPNPEQLCDIMRQSGLVEPQFELLCGGIIAIHHAFVE